MWLLLYSIYGDCTIYPEIYALAISLLMIIVGMTSHKCTGMIFLLWSMAYTSYQLVPIKLEIWVIAIVTKNNVVMWWWYPIGTVLQCRSQVSYAWLEK